MLELLNVPINDRFYDLVSSSKSSIRLCAPYVKSDVVDHIYSVKKDNTEIEYISNFNITNFHKKSSDIEAFETISSQNDKIYNCQILHAKIYIFDDTKAIITSSNLTTSGFSRNIEYGVYIDNEDISSKILSDFKGICHNERTGKITARKVLEIRSILDRLPPYLNQNIDTPVISNEIDDVLDVDKEFLTIGLSDWKKAMFTAVDNINKIEFSLADVYEKESFFTAKFPNNHTVRDSMRRNLQELRDIGLIKFLGNGKYIKLWK